jgi:peptidoglycan/LPS O-acetylase OafA/YrhL
MEPRMTSTVSAIPTVSAVGARPVEAGRMPFVGLLRAFAAQAIVLHHLAFYGPLSDSAYPLAPVAIDLLFDYGRFAVQIFFVLGGFMTARSLTSVKALGLKALGNILVRRYQRIGFPYLVTLIAAIGANALADFWMDHSSISPPPSFADLVAHALFLQDIFGFHPLSAGIWFLAVDFQLFVFLFLVGAVAQGVARTCRRWGQASDFTVMQAVFWPLAVLSLFWLNRDVNLDMWGVYFFGSYFLGMVLHWTLVRALPSFAFWGYAGLVVVAVGVDWRPRLLVALATAVLIWLMARLKLLERWPRGAVVEYLGKSSYSLFLIHFPVCLVVNAGISRLEPSPLQALGGMVLAYLLSQVAGVLFYELVEKPCLKLRVQKL